MAIWLPASAVYGVPPHCDGPVIVVVCDAVLGEVSGAGDLCLEPREVMKLVGCTCPEVGLHSLLLIS